MGVDAENLTIQAIRHEGGSKQQTGRHAYAEAIDNSAAIMNAPPKLLLDTVGSNMSIDDAQSSLLD